MPQLKDPRHELFAQEIAKGTVTHRAYEIAGYSPNPGNARTMRIRPKIAERINEILEDRRKFQDEAVKVAIQETGIDIASVLREIAKIAFANIADYVDLSGESPTWDLKDIPREVMAAVGELTTETIFDRTQSKNGKPVEVRKVKLKFWDKHAALVSLGKHLAMFTENVKHSGDQNAPIVQRIERVIVDPTAKSD